MNIKQLLLENKKLIIVAFVSFIAGAILSRIVIPLAILGGGLYFAIRIIKRKNEPKVVKVKVVK